MLNYPAVKAALTSSINTFSPSVVFTLDNEIGGYGHPGHVFISQLVLDLALNHEIEPLLIYQGVFTKHMEESILEGRLLKKLKSMKLKGNGWEEAKTVYGVSGMPEPNTQITIIDVADAKMNYLRSYEKRERKNIDFYIPAFEQYDANEYFSMLDR